MRRSLHDLCLGLCLLGLALLVFARLLAAPDSLVVDRHRPSIDLAYPGQARGIGNDLTFVFLPRYLAIVDHLRSWHALPLWDASGFAGRPLVGNPQAGLFYPPVWLAWMAGRPSALGWLTVAHLLGAGVGTFVLARKLRLGRLAALTSAACFEASPYLLAHVFEGHYPHVWSVCWYPWAFSAMLDARKGRARGALALAAVLALSFLAGHPQEWYYLILVLGFWALAEGVRRAWKHGAAEGVHWLAFWLGAIGLSLALCAVELLPDLAANQWTLRPDPVPARQIDRYHLHALNLAQLLSPSALGGPADYFGHDNYWETVFSAGLTTLVLATIGVARHRRRAATRSWLVLVLLASVFAAGRKLGLCALAHWLIPGMEQLRVPSRTLFFASLGASILAGFGIDALRSNAVAPSDWWTIRRRVHTALGVIASGVVVLMLLSRVGEDLNRAPESTQPTRNGQTRTSASTESQSKTRAMLAVRAIASDPVFWTAIVGMTCAFSAFGADARGRKATASTLVALAVIELILHAQTLLVVSPFEAFVRHDSPASRLSPLCSEPSGPFRIAAVGTLVSDLDAVRNRVEKTNVNDGFQIQHAADLYQRLYPILDAVPPWQIPDRPMDQAVEAFHARVARSILDRMSVRYLVTDRDAPFDDLERIELGVGPGKTVYRNPTSLPRSYVVPRALLVREDGRTAPNRLADVDPRAFVVLPVDPLDGIPGDRQRFTPAEWLGDEPGRVQLRVETNAPGLLVLGDTWMPGWRARVDGQTAPVLRGNHSQRVVPLRSPGKHDVVLEFEPPRYRAGMAITAGAIGIWGILTFFARQVRHGPLNSKHVLE